MRKSRRRWLLLLPLVPAFALAAWAKNRFLGGGKLPLAPSYTTPAPDAVWPWKSGHVKTLAKGVTQTSKVATDGTLLDLWEFDFAANPRLRWEIFDQDEDDEKPFDNHVLYWNRNVARATKELEAKGRGKITVA